MSRKTRRITVLGVILAVAVAFAAATTAASALTIRAEFSKYKVNGTLTDKKLNQTITLATGEFNGEAILTFVPEPGGMGFGVEGPLTGTVTIPPFEAEIKLLGIPAKIGLTFTSPPSKGSLTPVAASNCEGKPACENLSVPTTASIGFTTIKILGLTVPTHCETAQPVSLPLSVDETLLKLLGGEAPAGSFFKGTANFPAVKCEGPIGVLEGAVLTALFSGPENPYNISVTPPM
jgi:hypothetical protein